MHSNFEARRGSALARSHLADRGQCVTASDDTRMWMAPGGVVEAVATDDNGETNTLRTPALAWPTSWSLSLPPPRRTDAQTRMRDT